MSDSLHKPVRVSVVIPMRNEASSIHELIGSLQRQLLPPDEVILVDGGSTDQTVALAKQLCGDDPHYRIIEAGPATPGRGRNIGYKTAKFEWIAFMDAGCEVEPDWLLELVHAVRSSPQADVVHGNYEVVTDTFFTRCAALIYAPPRQPVEGYLLRPPVVHSSLFRKSVLETVGG